MFSNISKNKIKSSPISRLYVQSALRDVLGLIFGRFSNSNIFRSHDLSTIPNFTLDRIFKKKKKILPIRLIKLKGYQISQRGDSMYLKPQKVYLFEPSL